MTPTVVEFEFESGRFIGVSCGFTSALGKNSDVWSVIP